ncbi:MAG: hypothetical protein AVDCRST_MAG11-2871 [uncultured Gemmatimonadaceae bacterium]|uniref:Uncharacterized protein n=1 Tax=uncultured Gemmatimonadaceae bacterium TaxID=246130 RepID=A0A6J4LRA6_9BACT|nr:MAG: hypothetical protein AVDCRST_MAG11-2871 [uncultured Gemmatimonadaceae bacterium]
MKMQRNRFLYFAVTVAVVIVVWFGINFLAIRTR